MATTDTERLLVWRFTLTLGDPLACFSAPLAIETRNVSGMIILKFRLDVAVLLEICSLNADMGSHPEITTGIAIDKSR